MTPWRAFQLSDKVCCRCRSTGPFLLDPADDFTVTPDGEIHFPPGEWGLDIGCGCVACGFRGRLGDFCEWRELTGDELMARQSSSERIPVREVSANAYAAILRDEWPSAAAVLDFGIDSPEHLGALQYEFRSGRVTLEQFDDALGWGPAIQKLIGKDNPYGDVTFKTKWDELMVPIGEWARVTEGRFPLGRLFATPAALKAATQTEILDAMRRHAAGDWGDGNGAEDEAELEDGNEILSSHRAADGSSLFVRTWFTPPMTLALLEWQLDL